MVSDGHSFLHYCINYSQPDDAFTITELKRLWQVSGPGSIIKKKVAKKKTPNNVAHGEGSCTSDKINLGDNLEPIDDDVLQQLFSNTSDEKGSDKDEEENKNCHYNKKFRRGSALGSVFADDVSGPADGYTDCSDEDANSAANSKAKTKPPRKGTVIIRTL